MQLPLTLSFINSLVKLNNQSTTLQSDILSILQNADDEDKPDRLKAFISNHLPLNIPDHQLNQIILALLHQHRQDLNPNSKHSQQHQKQLPSELLIINQSKLLTNRSRFQSQAYSNSNSSSSAPSTPPPSARIQNQTTSNPPPPSIHLPWSDKLNASASEFKPSLSRAVSLPFTETTPTTSSRSPLAHHSNHLWVHEPLPSPLQSPNNRNGNLYHHQQQQPHSHSRPTTPEIPRDPWLRDELDQPTSLSNNKNLLSPKPILEFNSEEQDVSFDLFSPFHPTSPFRSPSVLTPISTQRPVEPQETSCPTALEWGLSPEMAEEMAHFSVWDQSDSDGSLPPTIVHHPAEEDSELLEIPSNRYCMTPFDELSYTLMGTGVTTHQIEQALSLSDFDISKALDWLLERNGIFTYPNNPSLLHTTDSSKFPNSSSRDSSPNRANRTYHQQLNPSSRPTSPRFNPPNLLESISSCQKKSKSTHNLDDTSTLELNPAHRICRFYLQGCCLRSDCKFSHDAGKAICRFWLKGNCLKGKDQCDFLHEIPDVMNEQEKEDQEGINKNKEKNSLNIKSFTDEFPSINESLLSNHNRKSNHNHHNNNNNVIKVSRVRPISLLPNRLIHPSPSLLKLCKTYSTQFFEFSERRKECFELAKECFKRGDGLGVKKWSREGDQWNKKLGEEGKNVAGLIINERNRLMKDAVRDLVSDRVSKVDEGPDRMHRGKVMGGGICLGVVKQTTSHTVKERTEVLLDLHGLQPEDGLYYLEKFLISLKTEGYQGLTYVILSIASTTKSTTTSTTTSSLNNNNEEKEEEIVPYNNDSSLRLQKTILDWLDKKKLDQLFFNFEISLDSQVNIGLVCIDPLRKV